MPNHTLRLDISLFLFYYYYKKKEKEYLWKLFLLYY
nr:MAG TPA: hypothetical protein [Caudoviricetes sp.]